MLEVTEPMKPGNPVLQVGHVIVWLNIQIFPLCFSMDEQNSKKIISENVLR